MCAIIFYEWLTTPIVVGGVAWRGCPLQTSPAETIMVDY
jgi:hypothetical protein